MYVCMLECMYVCIFKVREMLQTEECTGLKATVV